MECGAPGRGGRQKGWLTSQSRLYFHPCPQWSALPLPGGSYSLWVAHEETEAQTGVVTAQGDPALERWVSDLLDSGSSAFSTTPRQIGFQSVSRYPQRVLLSSPALPGPPAGPPSQHLRTPGGHRPLAVPAKQSQTDHTLHHPPFPLAHSSRETGNQSGAGW